MASNSSVPVTAAARKGKLDFSRFSLNSLICMILGFSSGLPLFMLVSLAPIYLRTYGVDLRTIGLFALLMFPYNWKFLWAPLCDSVFISSFGRRRTWMLGTQIPLLGLTALMGYCSPQTELNLVSALAVAVAVLSATQDIAVDAYRRELLSDRELGFGTSIHVNFYRLSALVPGSLALILSDLCSWQTAFSVTALFMLPGIFLSLVIREPQVRHRARGFSDAVVRPFSEFFSRMGLKGAVLFFLFLFAYKLGDSMATALITPFYTDMGFTPTQIGTTAKIIGTTASVVGALAGGLIMLKIGINRALWYFGLVQIITILGFAWLSQCRQDMAVLAIAVAGEYLGVGLGTASFTAFIARSTNPAHTATQFALFTSIAALPRVLCNSATGFMVEHLGWFTFFCVCFLLAVPGMLLLFWVAPFSGEEQEASGSGDESSGSGGGSSGSGSGAGAAAGEQGGRA